MVDGHKYPCYYIEKLNRLIEARYTRVLFGKARQPQKRKGKTAEA